MGNENDLIRRGDAQKIIWLSYMSVCERNIPAEKRDLAIVDTIGNSINAIAPAEAVHKPDYSYEADMVKRLRQAEAVQVVRCKDCIHYESDGGALMVCRIGDMVVDDTDYCSYGERKGGDDE